jgi:GTPase
VFNKADVIDDDRKLLLRGLEPDAVFVSAHTGEGIDELRARIADLLPQWDVELDLLVPYERGDVVALAHEKARVLETDYEEDGTRIRLVATDRIARLIRSALEKP